MRTIILAAMVGCLLARPCAAQTSDPARPGNRDCVHCPEMVDIPPGSVMMGSPPEEAGRRASEGPQRRVTIATRFALGRYEVTRAEFAAFVQATGHRAAGDWRNPRFPQTDRHPVVNVSWDDAKAYVAWLSQTTGRRYRLPSEAEWEYAARAGTATQYYWGDRHEDACRYANVDGVPGCRDDYKKTAPVGRFQPNAFGLHDMLGNVQEWIEDCWNESYAGAPVDGSAWQGGQCEVRVLRGGSWGDYPWFARAASRWWKDTHHKGEDLGFRVARSE